MTNVEKKVRLDVYSHSVKVSQFKPELKRVLFEFCRPLTQFGVRPVRGGKFVREMLRVYAAATKDRTEFRFHRHQLEQLQTHLKNYGIREESIKIVEHPLYTPVKADLRVNPKFKPRDYQVPVIEYLKQDQPSKLVTLQTGCIWGEVRVGVNINGKYHELPLSELYHLYGNQGIGGDIVSVRSFDGERVRYNRLEKVVYSGIKHLYRLQLSSGQQLLATIDHRVLTMSGYVPLGDLEEGDEVIISEFLQEGPVETSEVVSVTPAFEGHTYDLVCADPHTNFVANDVVVHNSGKSLISMMAMADIGHRVMMVIKGMYVEKWIEDVEEAYGLRPGEVMVIRGSKNFKALIDLAQAGELKAKFIICTNKTMYMYMKEYEAHGKNILRMGYGCLPEDLYRTLGVGVRIIDEVHQEFHTNFRMDLYTHVPTTINLSATMKHDDPFMERMYSIAFPPESRFKGIAYDKYISVKALMYSAEHIQKIRYIGKRKNYSHVVFEQSLMKQKRLLKKYLEMVYEIVETSYMKKLVPGQKMLIYFSTVDMCTLVTEQLKELYPNLRVERYVSDDDYENLMNADISISTLKSAGTAVDIESLRVVLMTDAVNSRQSNEQTVGRLRRLKHFPDVTPEFLYLVCVDIPQHIRYHNNKRDFLADKVLSQNEITLGIRL